MITSIARIFNPLLSPVFAFTLLLALIPAVSDRDLRLIYWLISCLFSSGLIFVYISYLKYKRVIKSTELIDREHRISPMHS